MKQREFTVCGTIALLSLFAFPHAAAACLSMEYNGFEDHWVNQCPIEVHVNWTDGGSCKDWSCSASVPANGRQGANKFIGAVKWCECQGSSCTVQGPC